MKKLTVIICTYNRAQLLDDCLFSLTQQNIGNEHFLVIVVDNNSNDNTREVIKKFIDTLDLLLYEEKEQGLAHARNTGVQVAQTTWVAFLDDDARARHNWVQSILDAIATAKYDCFGGVFYAWHRFRERPPWFDPQWESSAYFGNEDPCGGNCAMRRDVVLECGGFPVHLGMKGNSCAYGEETQLFRIMRERGYRIGHLPSIIIDHCVLPYKYSLRWRLYSAYAMARDGVAATNYTGPGMRKFFHRIMGAILHLFTGMHFWIKCLQKTSPWQRAFLDWLLPCAVRIGEAVGYLRHSLQQRFRS